jgi:hypothetical protein
LRRQFQRPAMIDRSVNGSVVQKIPRDRL